MRFVVLALGCAMLTPAPAAQSGAPTLLQRFLARDDPAPSSYRALRRLEAENVKFGARAWMDAWTEVGPKQFRFEVAAEGGSGYIRRRVLRAALEGEQKMYLAGDPERAALSGENYTFADGGPAGDGLASILVTPRRRDVLLVDGRVIVTETAGDLVRIEGRLSKTPSFWTRRVDVDRRYERIGDVRVPVSIESVAQVLIAGRSTFRMTYEYESINGRRVGDPRPRAATETPRR